MREGLRQSWDADDYDDYDGHLDDDYDDDDYGALRKVRGRA